MNKTALALSIFCSLVIIIVLLVFGFSRVNNKFFIHTPLPDFLTIFKNAKAFTLALWLPDLDSKIQSGLKKPDITAKSVLLYDLTTDKTILEINSKEKMPFASLTKIMTAIISLENQKKDDKYLVYKEDIVGEDSMGLDPGEILSLKELLYGLILHSGNDAAETLASNYPGGRTVFVKAMNDKAKSLGLKDTNFTNPSGLEGDGNQYTTAYDLLVMTNYAMNNFPMFRQIAKTPNYSIAKTATHKEFVIENETNLLTSYPGVKGVKTGYTDEAGLCLITYLDYGGHKIIGILLNSQNRRQEMKDLLDYSLLSLGVTPPPHD